MAKTISISGATGSFADIVNGTYDPVDEGKGIVYRKRGDPDKWLEWYGLWMVRDTQHRGTDWRWASLSSDPVSLPTDTRGDKWQVYDGTAGVFVEQPVVVVVSVT